jgi:PAS domain S-box-containing protein
MKDFVKCFVSIYLLKITLSAFFLVFVFLNGLFAQFSEKHKILIIHSHNQGYEWTDNLQAGISKTLSQRKDLELFVEYMDKTRHSDNDYLNLLESLYYYKYTKKNRIFDVIIVADDDAFNFIIERRSNLFPNIPIVFVGVDGFSPEKIINVGKITGVEVAAPITETVELALKLNPDIEKIVVVSGSRLSERILLNEFKEQSETFAHRIEFDYLSELEPEELTKSLKRLGENDIVFYLSYLLTPSGKSLTVAEIMDLIKSSTDAMIFTIRKFPIEFGAIGGRIVDSYLHGEAAANIALDIINGRNPDNIPLVKVHNQTVFNGHIISLYGYTEEQLPDSSIIIRRTPENLIWNWDNLKKDDFFEYDLFEKHGKIMLIIEQETGIILDANSAAVSFYGYPDLIGKQIQDINLLTWKEINVELKKSLGQNNVFHFQHKLVSGEIREVNAYIYRTIIDDRDVYFSIISDVTDKIIAERNVRSITRLMIATSAFLAVIIVLFILMIAIKNRRITKQKDDHRKSEKFFRLFAENSPVSILMTDNIGNTLYLNPKFNETFGYSIDDIPDIERWWPLAYPEEEYREIVKAEWGKIFLNANSESNNFEPVEYMVCSKNGQKNWISFNTKMTRDRCIIVLTDITHFKQAEKELLDSKSNMEDIVYLASHDLQTPLISIEGLSSELIENYSDKLDEEGVHCLKRLHANAIRMHNLVISLLKISNLITGSAKAERFVLNDVVDKIIEDLELHIINANAKINVGTLPEILADKQRIESVLRNIIVNAINYGGKNIDISYSQSKLFIKDNGIGIPAEQLQRVFAPGERLKMVEVEGIGMGLVYCQKVISQMNGKIWIESEGINRGATVIIKFSPDTIIG